MSGLVRVADAASRRLLSGSEPLYVAGLNSPFGGAIRPFEFIWSEGKPVIVFETRVMLGAALLHLALARRLAAANWRE
jgi:hypothetical protein